MLRLRKEKFNVLRRFSSRVKGGSVPSQETSSQLSKVASAIQMREASGLTTTLRQLHTVANLTQPEALNIIAELERLGVVNIDRHMGDAFESTITLGKDAQARLRPQGEASGAKT